MMFWGKHDLTCIGEESIHNVKCKDVPTLSSSKGIICGRHKKGNAPLCPVGFVNFTGWGKACFSLGGASIHALPALLEIDQWLWVSGVIWIWDQSEDRVISFSAGEFWQKCFKAGRSCEGWGQMPKLISKGGLSFHFSKAHFNWRKYFLDAIASPSSYPCQWVIFSDFGGSYHIYRAWELVQKMQWSKDLFFWGQEKHRRPHKQGDGISAALSRESALFKRFQALSKKTDGSKKKQSNLSQWFFEQITIPVDKVAKICWIGNLGNLKIHLWC